MNFILECSHNSVRKLKIGTNYIKFGHAYDADISNGVTSYDDYDISNGVTSSLIIKLTDLFKK